MKCDERSARHSYNEGRIKFGKKMYFELGSWEENRIFGRKGEKAKFETIFGIGIASVAGIFFGVLPLIVIFYYIFEIVLQGPSVIQEQIINIVLIIILVFPFLGIWICAGWVQAYACMISDGRYYLNEKGIQIEYYFHIHREICWKDIDIIERRTMSTDSREGEKASECDIFFICKKGCTEKEKKKKKRGIIFYTMHRKRIMLIGYSKEREEELRQYWDNEIRDQRK